MIFSRNKSYGVLITCIRVLAFPFEKSVPGLPRYISLRRVKEGLKKQVQARTNERQDEVLQSRQSVMVMVLSPSDSEARVT